MDERGSAELDASHTTPSSNPTSPRTPQSTTSTPTPQSNTDAESAPRALKLSVGVAIAGVAYLVALPFLSAQESAAATGAAISASTLADHGLGTVAWWVALTAVAVQATLLMWVRRAPVRTLAAVAAIAAAASAAAPADAAQSTLLAVIPAAYIAARYPTSPRTQAPIAWWAITGVLVWVARTASALPDPDFSTALAIGAGAAQAALGVGLPALIGVILRGRADMHAARERELIARADEQEARTEAALAAERTAIARELHDIAAHHLSGIAIMASAISQQVDTDPAAAKASLKDVRTQTRTLLDELRGLVTLLRSDEGAAIAVESLAGVEDLINSAHRRGQAVTLTLAPATDIAEADTDTSPNTTTPATTADRLASLAHGIGPLSQFAAYRTIQEALANAARHAPGAACEVTLTSTTRALEIDVTNAPPSPGHAADAPPAPASASPNSPTGFGLRGMQERAALTKSRLAYGPTDDGGWHVTLTVPREETR